MKYNMAYAFACINEAVRVDDWGLAADFFGMYAMGGEL